jgi:hypothetical protein
MADADSVTPGLATLLAQGWDVTEPGEGGRWGGLPPEIPANIAGPLSQMFSTVARLGGRAYIPWSPAISPAYYGNSDGSGDVPAVGGAVGLLLDSSGGWGVPSTPDQLLGGKDFTAGWGGSGSPSGITSNSFTTAGVGGLFRGVGIVSGRSYYMRIAGTTTAASGVNFRSSGGGAPFPNPATTTAGPFDFRCVVPVWGADTLIFIDNRSGGTTTIDWARTEVREIAGGAATNALTQATGINKPLLASGAVPWAGALEGDGSSRFMLTGNIAGAAQETLSIAFRKNSGQLGEMFAHGSGSAAVGDFLIRVNSAGNVSAEGHDGTAYRSAPTGPVATPGANLVATAVKGVASMYLRINGTQVATTPFALGAQAAPLPLAVLRGVTGAQFSNANVFGAIWVPVEASAADLAVMERGLGFLAGTVTS